MFRNIHVYAFFVAILISFHLITKNLADKQGVLKILTFELKNDSKSTKFALCQENESLDNK